VCWVEAYGLAMFEGEGSSRRATDFVGTVADITERKANESRLGYLASFPEKNTAPIIEADAHGNVRYANPAALRVLPEIRDLGPTHPWLSDWEQAAKAVRQAGGSSRIVASREHVYQQQLSYLPTDDTIRVYGLDITERAQAEEALRRRTSLLAGINRIAREAYGCQTEEELGRVCLSVAEELTGSKFGFLGALWRTIATRSHRTTSPSSCRSQKARCG
jgi:PAS domain-containing protein